LELSYDSGRREPNTHLWILTLSLNDTEQGRDKSSFHNVRRELARYSECGMRSCRVDVSGSAYHSRKAIDRPRVRHTDRQIRTPAHFRISVGHAAKQ
jgi:hypothetical protein